MAVTISGTTGVAGVDGSASTPSVQGADSNTGMFFPAADTIAFAEGGAEVARFNSSGYFGIGTSSPQAKLHAVAATTLNDDATYPIIAGDSSSTNRRLLLGYLGSGNGYGVIQSVSSGTAWTDTVINPNGGNLLVGCTATVSASVKGVQLATGSANGRISIASNTTGGSDMMYFYNPNGIVGAVGTTGSSTYYNTSSDYRLKEDVQPMAGALAKVAALKPVTYKWKSDGSAGEGFIAHELQAVVPGCVIGEKDAVDADGNPVYQGIDTSFLVATLTAAIQELRGIVDSQAARIAALEGAAQ